MCFTVKKERQHIQSLMRALDILEAVRDSSEPMRSTDIAAATGLGMATAHNIIRTLFARKYLAQDKHNRYLLGVECMQLQTGALNCFSRVRDAVGPVVRKLAEETNDTTFFGCEANMSLVCLSLCQGGGNLVVRPEQHWLKLLHCTGAGKVILAEKGIDWFAELAELNPPEKIAANTITTVGEMRVEIEKIKRNGYALCMGECSEDVSALGIPVYDKHGEFVGALAQSIPSLFIEAGRIDINERVKILRKHAEMISAQL